MTDYAHEINAQLNAERRAHRRKVTLARVGAAIAAGLVLGAFVNTIQTAYMLNPSRAALIVAVLLWGAWGLRFLLTRHH